MRAAISLRSLQPGDEPRLLAVYTSAIHRVASKDYSPEQIRAWAPPQVDPARWLAKMQAINPIVALLDGTPVGYADLQPDGSIDHFFVSGEHSRQGIGSQLMSRLLADAHTLGIPVLSAHVSRTAQPFFERFGFVVTAQRSPVVRGVVIPNAAMQRPVL